MSNQSEPLEFDHSFEIYVPTQCRCGKMLPEHERNQMLDEIKARMSSWFGGTSTKSAEPRVERIEGSFLHESGNLAGELAKETVDVVQSFATKESLAEHREEFTVYVAQLANRLTQEMMACRIDEKSMLFPSSEDVKPHRCMGGKLSGELPTPLQPDELSRMRTLQTSLQRISGVRDARDLFCNVLHYEYKDEQLAMVGWPDKLKECLASGTAPRIIADQNGFKILYLQLAEDYLRKGYERQLIQRIIKDDPTLRGLVVVSDIAQKQWHLVNAKFEKEEGKRERLHLRRMRVGPDQSVRTAVDRLSMVDIETAGEETSAAELQDLHDRAFDVESVSKEFFKDISNWYFWALSEVKFPTDVEDDNEQYRATSTIRLLTRIIFCWFLKEKGLVPGSLFREKDLAGILVDLQPDSSSYYQGILQNLFFATLNQQMGKDNKGKPYRAFAKGEGPQDSTFYRYAEHFQNPDIALSNFGDIPFLNGGLFECLDRIEKKTGRKLYVDGFSRDKNKQACVPNRLFFSPEQTVDLSGPEAYGANRYRSTRVRGLLHILYAYNFTIEENTPVDEEIALDPELLGKVFENLLASYNPETQITARKQTGSFYTPRPIVEYMVDESLRAYLLASLVKDDGDRKEVSHKLDQLLSYEEHEPLFEEAETSTLLTAIHSCKILDPACGSGAFPIGMLQKLVHVIHKLDPDNNRWKNLQIESAKKIPDASARNAAVKAVERDFSENGDDYGRKLYLIENCLYGVDIQPIAIQISKLRFFISLICEQKTSRNKAKNHNVRPLPNLETKFVAANTLVRLKQRQLALDAFANPKIKRIEDDLQRIRHEHFSAQTRRKKLTLQKRDAELREHLANELVQLSFADQSTSQRLANWDPYDAQNSAPFFEPLWMFDQSLTEGFDIVLGNPPYYKENDDRSRFDGLRDLSCYLGKMDVWYLFADVGLDLLKPGGMLTFIATNNWVTNTGARKLRNKILKETSIDSFIDFGDHMVFESASIQTMVMVLTKRKQPATFKTFVARAKPGLDKEDLRKLGLLRVGGVTNMITFSTQVCRDDWIDKPLVFNPEDENFILDLIQRGGPVFLKKSEISQGIVPNPDKINSRNIKKFADKVVADRGIDVGDGVFVLTGKEREKILTSERSYLRPLFEPVHIEKYRLIETEQAILYTKKGSFDPKKNPSIIAHLKRFKEVMEDRRENRNGQIEFYNLHWPRNESVFEPGEKILAPRKCVTPTFYFTNERAYVMLAVNVIRTSQLDMKYLTGLLNSSTVRYWLRRKGKMQGSNFQIDADPLQLVPLANPSREAQNTIAAIVTLLQLDASAPVSSTPILEELLDACVMECYFKEHMEERNLGVLADISKHLREYSSDESESIQRAFLGRLSRKISAKDSNIRKCLDRICEESPDLLSVINEEKRA